MYNYKGELTQEDNVECQVLINYEYNNGNIASKTYDNYGTNPKIDSYSFEYNNEKSKDILTKVTKNGIIRNVSYTDSYFGNPTNIPVNN